MSRHTQSPPTLVDPEGWVGGRVREEETVGNSGIRFLSRDGDASGQLKTRAWEVQKGDLL